jgi:hypothetical protein
MFFSQQIKEQVYPHLNTAAKKLFDTTVDEREISKELQEGEVKRVFISVDAGETTVKPKIAKKDLMKFVNLINKFAVDKDLKLGVTNQPVMMVTETRIWLFAYVYSMYNQAYFDAKKAQLCLKKLV